VRVMGDGLEGTRGVPMCFPFVPSTS
jgi:hypothetical protein